MSWPACNDDKQKDPLTGNIQNGTITTASNDRNTDLFFALKGGLNRFGIVTSAEFYTHPQPPKVWVSLPEYLSTTRPVSELTRSRAVSACTRPVKSRNS